MTTHTIRAADAARYPDKRDPEGRLRSKPASTIETRVLQIAEPSPEIADSGLLLMNMAMQPVAWDCGAADILQQLHQNSDGLKQQHQLAVPEEILHAIRGQPFASEARGAVSIWIGRRCYHCRFYVIQSAQPAIAAATFAVHLDSRSNGDRIRQMAAEHHLTDREGEALRGIALGLSTKELADHMAISPNTVKSFVRLIMLKLGVGSRAGIMVKLLESK